MNITATGLTKAAGAAAAVAGSIFIAVQIKHPATGTFTTETTQWVARSFAKTVMAALALAGITGMYLRQVKQIGVLGLLGYVVFSVGYLAMLSIEVIGVVVLPSIVDSAPGYVSDVLAVAVPGGHATGDLGLIQPLISVMGIGFLGGSVLFGIALFRANVLARWAAALLAVGAVATPAITLLPQVNFRLFAIPTGVAMVGLGYSLWREQRTPAAASVTSRISSQLDPAGAK